MTRKHYIFEYRYADDKEGIALLESQGFAITPHQAYQPGGDAHKSIHLFKETSCEKLTPDECGAR